MWIVTASPARCRASPMISFRGRSRLPRQWSRHGQCLSTCSLRKWRSKQTTQGLHCEHRGRVQSSRRIWKVKLSPPLPIPMPRAQPSQSSRASPAPSNSDSTQPVRCDPPRPHRTGPPAPASQPATPSRTVSCTPAPAPGTDWSAAPPSARLPRGSPPAGPLP